MNLHNNSTLDMVCKPANTPISSDQPANTPISSDYDCELWVWSRTLPLVADTLRSVGESNFGNIRLCQIILRLVEGEGYRFKAQGKIYEIDPNFFNLLASYYHELKDKNPAKLAEFVSSSDLNIFVDGGGNG